MAIKKNDINRLRITEQGKTGDGVGRLNDIPVYVPNVLPGDVIEAKIVRVEKRRAYGKCLRIIEQSNDRVLPACEVSDRCGGCQIQHQSLDAQALFKHRLIQDRLGRFVELSPDCYQPIISAPSNESFRNKMQFAFGVVNGQLTIGLYAARSHRVIDVSHCTVMSNEMNGILDAIRNWHAKHLVPVYDELTGEGVLRYVMIRYAYTTHQLMVVLTGAERLPNDESLVHALRAVPGMMSIYYSIQGNQQSDDVIGDAMIHLWGEPTIEDCVLDLSCRVSPRSFMQSNAKMVDTLYSTFIDGILRRISDRSLEIIDLYCGTGILTCAIAKKVASINHELLGDDNIDRNDMNASSFNVIGVDNNADAIADAIVNATQNNVDVAFVCESAEAYLASVDCSRRLVVMDPPRQGCHPSVLAALCKYKPPRLALMSCYLDTLGRDLRRLMDGGYRVESVQGVDMFPQTAHIEVLLFLTLR